MYVIIAFLIVIILLNLHNIIKLYMYKNYEPVRRKKCRLRRLELRLCKYLGP